MFVTKDLTAFYKTKEKKMNYQNSVGTWRLLSKPKLGGMLNHMGILRPDGLVVHNSPSRGEYVSTVAEFAAGQVISDCGEIPTAYISTLKKNLAVLAMNQKPYNALNNNCEHLITKLLGGRSRSPQLERYATVALAAALFGLVFG
jgi:hypothetical protein